MKDYFSASQISVYLDCPRKWAWTAIDGLEAPRTKASDLGTQVHEVLEKYLRGEIRFEELDLDSRVDELASRIILHLPEPHPSMMVEHEFKAKIGAHKYVGKIDLVHEGTIFDHKTTSSIARWAKTPELLVQDPQAILYARYLFVGTSNHAVGLQWTYAETRGAGHKAVRTSWSRDETEVRFMALESVADEMAAWRASGARALQLPAEARACDKYGGCPFVGMCNLTAEEKVRSIMSNGVDSLISRLRKGTTDNPPPPAKPGQINPPEGEALVPAEARPEPVAAAPAEEPKKKPAKAAAKARNPIGTLYVACKPLGTVYTLVEEVLSAAQATVCNTDFRGRDGATYRVKDYRQVEYGQGAAALREACRQVLEARRVEDLVAAMPATPEVRDTLSLLVVMADRIVMGNGA